jgi:hypothetical protein
MTKIVFPCGCSEDIDGDNFVAQIYCPMHGPPQLEEEDEEAE